MTVSAVAEPRPSARPETRRDLRIGLVYPWNPNRADAIADYSERLAAELKSNGVDAEVHRPKGWFRTLRAVPSAGRRDSHRTVIVQYNPFSWGRWGFAPGLLLGIAITRLVFRATRVVIMVHEPYVPREGVRGWLMGSWQRAQLRVALKLSHTRLASTEQFARELSRFWPRLPVTTLPVGSSLPDERRERDAERARRQIGDHIVIATLSSGHESHLRGFVIGAVTAIAERVEGPIALLMLGSGNSTSPELRALPHVSYFDAPGYLDASSLAKALATADVFLAPYMDGASGRRTGLIAALQHGIAIVTTIGPGSDELLCATDALLRSATRSSSEFAALAVEVVTNQSEWNRLRTDARELYDRLFAWPAICGRLLDQLEGPR